MSAWQRIPADGNIPHQDMVLVRKPLPGGGGYHVGLAYKATSGRWRADNGAVDARLYAEWAPIPE